MATSSSQETEKSTAIHHSLCNIDFLELADRHPAILKAFVTRVGKAGGGDEEKAVSKGRINFANPRALIALTKAILLDTFEIKWDMPEKHLCPPVLNRFNYVYWVSRLLSVPMDYTGLASDGTKDAKRNTAIIGIDIGVGASCIYPLLGHKTYDWRFIGTECDPISMASARDNVRRNGWEKSIEIRLADAKRPDVLLGALRKSDGDRIDFCMCNPPFFETSVEEDAASYARAVCEKTHSEAVFESGGEEGFVSRIIDDSTKLKRRIRWYTSMIGRKKSLKSLLRRLRSESGIKEICTFEFKQGRKHRWGLAWSYFKVSSAAAFVAAKVSECVSNSARRTRRAKKRRRVESGEADTNLDRENLERNMRFDVLADPVVVRERVDEFFSTSRENAAKTTSSDERSTASWLEGLSYAWTNSHEMSGSTLSSELTFQFRIIRLGSQTQLKVEGEEGQGRCACVLDAEIRCAPSNRNFSRASRAFEVLSRKLSSSVQRTSRYWRRLRCRSSAETGPLVTAPSGTQEDGGFE